MIIFYMFLGVCATIIMYIFLKQFKIFFFNVIKQRDLMDMQKKMFGKDMKLSPLEVQQVLNKLAIGSKKKSKKDKDNNEEDVAYG